jgi:hypothetical protein
VLPGQLDRPASINEACRSHDAGQDRLPDRACTEAGRHLESVPVRHLDDDRDFLRRHLGLGAHTAEGKHRPRSDHFQEVGAARHREFGLAAKFVRAAGDTHAELCRDRRFRMTRDHEIAAAARNGQVETRDLHTRPDDATAVDFVAQRTVRPRDMAPTSRVVEPGEESHSRGSRAITTCLRGPAVVHAQVGGNARLIGEVHAYDQTRRQVCRQVGTGSPRGTGTYTGHDAPLPMTTVWPDRAREAVDRRAATDCERSGVRREQGVRRARRLVIPERALLQPASTATTAKIPSRRNRPRFGM